MVFVSKLVIRNVKNLSIHMYMKDLVIFRDPGTFQVKSRPEKKKIQEKEKKKKIKESIKGMIFTIRIIFS